MPNLKVDKPWGYEIVLTESNLPYCAKIIFIKSNRQISLQYHDKKQETITLFSGQAELIIGSDKNNLQHIDMLPQNGYTVNSGTIHRIKTSQESIFFEASLPELGTTYRLEDDYNRIDEDDQIRNSQRHL